MRILITLLLALLATPAAADVSGPARVVDGDSIVVAGQPVRLWGIDAPESLQHCGEPERQWPCGRLAVDALRAIIAGRPVSCQERTRDRYARAVAVCAVDGRDIGAAMVEGGWALAFVRYSRDYVVHEDRARAERRGMHAGPHMAPWEWRAMRAGR